MGGHERVVGQRLARGREPVFGLVQGLLQTLLMQRGALVGQLHHFILAPQGGHGGKTFRRRPGFDARAAPTRFNQPDGHAQLLVQFAPEIIGGGRKPAPASFGDGLRRADFPCALDIVCGSGYHLRSPATGAGRDNWPPRFPSGRRGRMPIPISMFDWPEQSHTSPIITSSNSTELEPATLSVNGPPAFMAGSVTFHSPRSLACACAVADASVTVTVSLGCAQPQIARGISCWRTMWLANTFGNRTSALAGGRPAPLAKRAAARQTVRKFFEIAYSPGA